MRWRWSYVLWLVPIALVGGAWVTDAITMQGERTVYTAHCHGGTWDGGRCKGKLVAGDRYRYRALKARGEVLFWLVGSPEPSGKFTGCQIQDGRNWTCPANADAARSVTIAMARGAPVPSQSAVTRPYHAISKATWVLLDYGLWAGSSAGA
jgi:hypothetical protein